MGIVYRVHDLTAQRPVALKTIKPECAHDESVTQRFRREIEIMRRLEEHRHIVHILDEGTLPNGTFYFTMFYIPGEDLKKLIFERRYQFSLKEISVFLDQIGSALAYAHGRRVSHRDIKPSNIIKAQDGNFFLTDFGIAVDHDLTRTRTRRFVGTKEYAAPEILKGDSSTPCSDVYSLGITLFEMCLNSRYVDACDQTNGAPFRFLEKNPTFAPYTAILQRAVHPEPQARYASIADLAHDFAEQVRRSTPITIPSRSAPAAAPPRIRRAQHGERVALFLVIIVVVVLVLALLTFFSLQNSIV